MLTNPQPIEDDRIVAKCYVELGDVTKEKGEYDESLRYHRKSMEIFERIDDQLSVADSHLNMAEIYKAKGELKQAMSEYEIGLELYEDVYVEDSIKSNDSGADGSLNSSFTSDLQRSKSFSKSNETLPQTTLIDVIAKNISSPSPHPLNGEKNLSMEKLDEIEDIPQLPKSIDDSSINTTEKVSTELVKSLSSSNISDLQYVIDNNVLLPLTPPVLPYDTTVKTVLAESQIIETSSAPFVPPLESINKDLLLLTTNPSLLDTNLKDTNNSNQLSEIKENTVLNNKKKIVNTQRWWYHLPKTQILLIILTVFLTGALFWSVNNIRHQSLFSCLPNDDASLYDNSLTHNYDDLSEQLRKLLIWRKDRMASLNKDTRDIIKEFLTNSDIESEMTLDEFQRILEILDLKIILVPQ